MLVDSTNFHFCNLFCIICFFYTFAASKVQFYILYRFWLKGNQVKVLNSPAAVSSSLKRDRVLTFFATGLLWEGVKMERVRKPAFGEIVDLYACGLQGRIEIDICISWCVLARFRVTISTWYVELNNNLMLWITDCILGVIFFWLLFLV